jgi:LPS sulfotransferase NodH
VNEAPPASRQGPFEIIPAPQPRGIDVRVSGLIATLPRSGSWLLSDGLAATGLVGQPAEFFRPDYLPRYRKAWGLAPGAAIEDYVRAALDRTASTDGVFTAKLHWYQFAWLIAQVDIAVPGRPPSTDSIADLFPGLRFVYLTRNDRCRQAMSYYIATQSQRWFEQDPTAPRLTDDPDWQPDMQQVRFLDDAVTRHETAWETVLGVTECPVHQLSYEDLAEDRQSCLVEVLTFLEVENAVDVALPAPNIVRQSDASSDVWVERYRAVRDGLDPLTNAYTWSVETRSYIKVNEG